MDLLGKKCQTFLFQFPVVMNNERLGPKTRPQSLISVALAKPCLQLPGINQRRFLLADGNLETSFLTLNLQVCHTINSCITILQCKDISWYKPYIFRVHHNYHFILLRGLAKLEHSPNSVVGTLVEWLFLPVGALSLCIYEELLLVNSLLSSLGPRLLESGWLAVLCF